MQLLNSLIASVKLKCDYVIMIHFDWQVMNEEFMCLDIQTHPCWIYVTVVTFSGLIVSSNSAHLYVKIFPPFWSYHSGI